MSILTSIAGFAARPVLTAAAPYLIGAVVLAGGGYVAYEVHHQRQIGRDEVQLKWDADKSERLAQALAATAENRRIENRRQSVAAEVQQRKEHEIQAINTRLAAALGELRNRPERPAGGAAPVDTPVAASCTGAGLYRPDAAFLIGEAAAAARIAAERDACHERYDSLTVKP